LDDTGCVVTDSLTITYVVQRALSDTGLSSSDSLSRIGYFYRLISDTGASVSDFLTSGAHNLISISDTLTSITDSIFRSAVFNRPIYDVGLDPTDTLSTSRSRSFSDTGIDVSDSLNSVVVRARSLTDTGISCTDSLTTSRSHSVTDTGVSVSDALLRSAVFSRPLVDPAIVLDNADSTGGWSKHASAGLALDSLRRVEGTASVRINGGSTSDGVNWLRKTLSATNLSNTTNFTFWFYITNDPGFNTIGRNLYVRFGTSASDYWQYAIPGGTFSALTWTQISIPKSSFAAVGSITDWTAITTMEFSLLTAGGGALNVDTARALTTLYQSDSIASNGTFNRTLSDTGLTSTDAIQITSGRNFTDVGLDVSDTLSRSVLLNVSLTDAGLTLVDALATTRYNSASDIGLLLSDTLDRVLNAPRTLTDTALVVSDTLALDVIRVRSLSDVALSLSDSLDLRVTRPLTDTCTTITDTLAKEVSRSLTDIGLDLTDSLSYVLVRQLIDSIAGLTDSLDRSASFYRFTNDTGVSVTDALDLTSGRNLSDTLTGVSDSISTIAYYNRALTDSLAAILDSLVVTATGTQSLSDTGLSLLDSLARQGIFYRSLPDTLTGVTDALESLLFAYSPLSDTGLDVTDALARTLFAPRELTDTTSVISDSIGVSVVSTLTQVERDVRVTGENPYRSQAVRVVGFDPASGPRIGLADAGLKKNLGHKGLKVHKIEGGVKHNGKTGGLKITITGESGLKRVPIRTIPLNFAVSLADTLNDVTDEVRVGLIANGIQVPDPPQFQLLDDFNRPDGPLGAPWIQDFMPLSFVNTGYSANEIEIVNNRAVSGLSDPIGQGYVEGTAYRTDIPPTQEVWAICRITSIGYSGYSPGVAIRIRDPHEETISEATLYVRDTWLIPYTLRYYGAPYNYVTWDESSYVAPPPGFGSYQPGDWIAFCAIGQNYFTFVSRDGVNWVWARDYYTGGPTVFTGIGTQPGYIGLDLEDYPGYDVGSTDRFGWAPITFMGEPI